MSRYGTTRKYHCWSGRTRYCNSAIAMWQRVRWLPSYLYMTLGIEQEQAITECIQLTAVKIQSNLYFLMRLNKLQ